MQQFNSAVKEALLKRLVKRCLFTFDLMNLSIFMFYSTYQAVLSTRKLGSIVASIASIVDTIRLLVAK